MAPENLEHVARLIQLSVAPIFLLTGVATTLLVLTTRLGRVVDRGRTLETRATRERPYHEELDVIERRARIIYWALSLGVTAAILVCLLMTAAFLGEVLRLNSARLVVILFLGALFAYTGALVSLLREVFLAVGSFRLEIHHRPN